MINTRFALGSISQVDGITLMSITLIILIRTTLATKSDCEFFLANCYRPKVMVMGFHDSTFIVVTRDERVFQSSKFIHEKGQDMIMLPPQSKSLADAFPKLAESAAYQAKKINISTGVIYKGLIVFLMYDGNQQGLNYDINSDSVTSDGYKYFGPSNIQAVSTPNDYFYKLENLTFPEFPDTHSTIAKYVLKDKEFNPEGGACYFCEKANVGIVIFNGSCPKDSVPLYKAFWIGFQHQSKLYIFDPNIVYIFDIRAFGTNILPYSKLSTSDFLKCDKKGSGKLVALLIILIILIPILVYLYYNNYFAPCGLARTDPKKKESSKKKGKNKTKSKKGDKSKKSHQKAGPKSTPKPGQKAGPKSTPKPGTKPSKKPSKKFSLKSDNKTALGKRPSGPSGSHPASKNSKGKPKPSKPKPPVDPSKPRPPVDPSKWPPTLPTSIMPSKMKSKHSSSKSKQKP